MLTNSNNESLETSQDAIKRPSIKTVDLGKVDNSIIDLEIVEGNVILPDL